MNEKDVFVRKTPNYRIWVDEVGTGRIRVLKRINFKILMILFEEIHGEIKKRTTDNPGKVRITFYISKSLYNEMSANAKEFLEFCQFCMGVQFELVLTEI
ncbi:MAG TPA: hypothetical protein VIO11_00135 [Candidatus Methanoperedens sp.]